jgi:hypothetical protein
LNKKDFKHGFFPLFAFCVFAVKNASFWHGFCNIFTGGRWPDILKPVRKRYVSGRLNYFLGGSMKKIALPLLLMAIAAGIACAQTAPATSTVNGTLGLSGGRIILKSGDTTYYTRGLERFIGFIDGLKDGAQAAIEGYVSPPSLEGAAERLLFPVKLTIGGKDYEVGPVMTGAWDRRHPMPPGRAGRDGPGWGFSRRHGCW